MERSEFLIREYESLRVEVAATKSRLYKTIGYGIAIVPAATLLAQKYELDTLTLSLPILVIVVAMLYLSENNALMRCGQYIRENIEHEIQIKGWEHWLESNHVCKPRNVDMYLTVSFYLLFFIYYLSCSFMSCQFMLNNYSMVFASIMIGLYTAVGIWFFIFLLKNIKTSTAGNADKSCK